MPPITNSSATLGFDRKPPWQSWLYGSAHIASQLTPAVKCPKEFIKKLNGLFLLAYSLISVCQVDHALLHLILIVFKQLLRDIDRLLLWVKRLVEQIFTRKLFRIFNVEIKEHALIRCLVASQLQISLRICKVILMACNRAERETDPWELFCWEHGWIFLITLIGAFKHGFSLRGIVSQRLFSY